MPEKQLDQQREAEAHHDGDGARELPEKEAEAKGSPGFAVHDRRFWNLSAEELAAEPAQPKLPTYLERLQRQLDDREKQLREYIAAYKQEVVEGLERTKERLERDAANQLQALQGRVAEPMMEVLDALERSLAAAQSATSLEAVVQGVKLVHLLMLQKLQELGLSRIETVGQHFDPTRHEAAAIVPVTDPAQDNVIAAEFKPGFMMGERLVRPALVQVGKLQQ